MYNVYLTFFFYFAHFLQCLNIFLSSAQINYILHKYIFPLPYFSRTFFISCLPWILYRTLLNKCLISSQVHLRLKRICSQEIFVQYIPIFIISIPSVSICWFFLGVVSRFENNATSSVWLYNICRVNQITFETSKFLF